MRFPILNRHAAAHGYRVAILVPEISRDSSISCKPIVLELFPIASGFENHGYVDLRGLAVGTWKSESRDSNRCKGYTEQAAEMHYPRGEIEEILKSEDQETEEGEVQKTTSR
jgi:hypothetical protein